jgi:8-oxo-dGTP diphosphatase
MTKPYQKNAVHGLIKNGNKYLITRRSKVNDWKPGEWDIAGGTVEFGELNPKEALAREILEETGLVVKIGNLIHLYSSMSGPLRHQFQFVYECDYQGGDIKLDPEEHEEFRWVSVEEMGKLNLIAFLRSLYDEFLKTSIDI